MTSQGQRFRRRALRRGYKVDEVDSFLDRHAEPVAVYVLHLPDQLKQVRPLERAEGSGENVEGGSHRPLPSAGRCR